MTERDKLFTVVTKVTTVVRAVNEHAALKIVEESIPEQMDQGFGEHEWYILEDEEDLPIGWTIDELPYSQFLSDNETIGDFLNGKD